MPLPVAWADGIGATRCITQSDNGLFWWILIILAL
uniref:Uncharacterized protein n=1 Tax=Anguilla anguilla TaxID=7936 RepID=A0A0E9TYP7_ANGAN